MPTMAGHWLLVLVLVVLLLSAIFGVAVFSAATAAQHADAARKDRIEKHISWMGFSHAVFLCVGLIVLGGMLYDRVLLASPNEARQNCCCESA